MATVSELVAALGPTQLHVVHGPADAQVRDVSLVAVGDDGRGAAPDRGDLLLCVAGEQDAARLPDLIRRWGGLGVAAVALGGDLPRVPEVVRAAHESRVCLLAVAPGTAWAPLVWLLISLLGPRGGDGGAHGQPDSTSTGFGELFTLADTLAAVLGGPVTIEDAASRVLAHSARQEGADPARLSTIVGRRVPAELTERFRSMGVLRALQRSDEPVMVPSWAPGISPRLVIGVRAGRELLGSIWAVVDHPVPAGHAAELQRVVSVLALHLLRLRAQEDLVGRLEAERTQAALTGAAPAGWALPGKPPWRVVCLAEAARAPAPGHGERWRSVLRWSGWRAPLVAEVDGALFALVDGGPSTRAGSWSWLVENTDTGLVAASEPVPSAASLVEARVQAAEVMQLLRSGSVEGGAAGERRLVTAEDAWAALTVARGVTGVAQRPLTGPVARLVAHDRTTGTTYAATLAAAVAHPGDPRAAARSLHVHPNTFRYRMRRLAEVVELDLTDPSVRLAVQLQLLAASGDAVPPG